MSQLNTLSKVTSCKLKSIPIVIKKNQLQTIIQNNLNSSNNIYKLFNQKCKIHSQRQAVHIKEELVYESASGDFLKGEYPLVLLNRLNLLTYGSQTVAITCTPTICVEKTSDNITKLIGQKNYDVLFAALCSVINIELKVRGMLALLTDINNFNKEITQNVFKKKEKDKVYLDKSCQTDESYLDMLFSTKPTKRKRHKATPYAVRDLSLKRDTIEICVPNLATNNYCKELPSKTVENVKITDELNMNIKSLSLNNNPKELENIKIETVAITEIKDKNIFQDSENSNQSLGNLSDFSYPDLYEQDALHKIDQCIVKGYTLRLDDRTGINLPFRPLDMFHIATPEVLKNVTREEKVKLFGQQMINDWKFCQVVDDDRYYPIQHAVENRDVDLLKRMCVVLQAKNLDVDMALPGQLTALQMSLATDCPLEYARILLQYRASILHTDEEGRTALHVAAEAEAGEEKVALILDHCRRNAREILKDCENLWNPSCEELSDERLAQKLLSVVCSKFDEQGYSALMTSARSGLAKSVLRFFEGAGPGAPGEAWAELVAAGAPNSGDTALHVAVRAACLHAKEKSSKKIAKNYLDTIEILLEHGADPSLENHSGASVTSIVSEFQFTDLTICLAKRISSVLNNPLNVPKGFGASVNSILIKDEHGNIKQVTTKNTVVKVNKNLSRSTAVTNMIASCKEKIRLNLENTRNEDAKTGNLNVIFIKDTEASGSDKNKLKKPEECKNLDVMDFENEMMLPVFEIRSNKNQKKNEISVQTKVSAKPRDILIRRKASSSAKIKEKKPRLDIPMDYVQNS